jgi:hypothetical protein
MIDQSLYDDLKLLQGKRIFFGHQSIGNNIIQGIKGLVSEYPDLHINFIRVKGETQIPGSYFADALIGQNGKPQTKCDTFESIIDSTLHGRMDIALMKFCYVDIKDGTDITAVLKQYDASMTELSRKYPGVRFVHVTVPLVEQTPKWKMFIKRLLGRVDHPELDNRVRCTLNTMIKERYQNESIFDLAEVESTYPSGARETYALDGHTYFSLVPAYALDGSHLNELGRGTVGTALIHRLAQVIRGMNRNGGR